MTFIKIWVGNSWQTSAVIHLYMIDPAHDMCTIVLRNNVFLSTGLLKRYRPAGGPLVTL